jgi:hypothetical protein
MSASMSAPRRSARLAAKAAAKAAPAVVPETLSDADKVMAMLKRHDAAVDRLARVKINTEMFVLLKTATLWKQNAYFRSVVEKKIIDYIEHEMPSCLRIAFQTHDHALEWAIYGLEDAIENLVFMMKNEH